MLIKAEFIDDMIKENIDLNIIIVHLHNLAVIFYDYDISIGYIDTRKYYLRNMKLYQHIYFRTIFESNVK